ncbi:TetR family transcriptional regulator [Pseudomonas sp. nanlin1]|uniref:TetR/AcrR family transcriptional regulator n=1 Tax=Pseudomonas sp. nanlin1 TaxID=3040605 RepID=UPI00388DA9FE
MARTHTVAQERKKPGRPEGAAGFNRDQLLDAAELMFSNQGYAGTSLREIAAVASVNQALINYYFGSKYGLFEEVYLRKGGPLSAERMLRLNALDARGDFGLEEVVRAFMEPSVALLGDARGRAFMRLQARIHTEPPELSYGLRQKINDESTRACVQAFRRAKPDMSEAAAFWSMTLMFGAYMFAFSDTHRLDQLAPGICRPDDAEEVLEYVCAFVVGGISRL